MQERRTKDLEKELSACAELHKFLEDNQEYMVERPLSELLLMYLDKKEMTRAEVIEGSGLNDIYTHQIFAGKRKPSRDKLLCLCFGLKLTAEETQLLLKETGYVPLYVKKRRDSIILYAFIKELTLIECNDLLYEEKERLLS
ncbi:MAG: XRE family transcriptional regulator [Clostridia bacterium]|nr:XRE family transcriptional regulator [Clostridia bacterium]